MKKILLSIGVVLTSLSYNAQVVDTLTEFFTGTPTIYGSAGGYVSGNNEYDDKSKMQLFDLAHGVSNNGIITELLLWAPVKSDAGGSFRAVIWADVAGTPGAELGSVTIDLTAVDTTLAAMQVADGAVIYNVSATFTPPITIPTSKTFWAGVVLPTTDDTGDTLALVSNTDGDFADGLTHTGEFWSDDTFHTFADPGNWGLNIAMAIFPVVNMLAGVEENEIAVSVYPNPASDVLNIKLNENASSVSILGMDGKVISTETVNSNTVSVNVSNLVSGVYFYQVVTENGTAVRNTFVKK